MIDEDTPDAEAIEQLRRAYPDKSTVGLPTLETIRAGARRRRRTRRVTVAAAASAVVVAVAIAAAVVTIDHIPRDGSGPKPAATRSTQSRGPLTAAQLEHVADEIYAEIDTNPRYDLYMLKVDHTADTIIVWRKTNQSATDQAITRIAATSGVELDLRPPPGWKQLDQQPRHQIMTDAETKMDKVLFADQRYGYCVSRLEVPLKTIVIWRHAPNNVTDQALQQIADKHGVNLELRVCKYSGAQLAQLHNLLQNRYHKLNRDGFKVVSTDSRYSASGIFVEVRGDLRAARHTIENLDLSSYPKILGYIHPPKFGLH